MNQMFLLSGAPGAGKTTTLRALESRGFASMPDAARGIIRERLEQGLSPRPGPVEFAKQVLRVNESQYDLARQRNCLTFFEYGVVEALMMLRELDAVTEHFLTKNLRARPFNRAVFFFPPWESIYTQDGERDQTYQESVEVSVRTKRAFEDLGFDLVMMPFSPPDERANFILETVDSVRDGQK